MAEFALTAAASVSAMVICCWMPTVRPSCIAVTRIVSSLSSVESSMAVTRVVTERSPEPRFSVWAAAV